MIFSLKKRDINQASLEINGKLLTKKIEWTLAQGKKCILSNYSLLLFSSLIKKLELVQFLFICLSSVHGEKRGEESLSKIDVDQKYSGKFDFYSIIFPLNMEGRGSESLSKIDQVKNILRVLKYNFVKLISLSSKDIY